MATQYCGSVKITFMLSKKEHIFLDYSGTEVGDINFNGVKLEAANVFSGHRIKLRPDNQIVGQNVVTNN